MFEFMVVVMLFFGLMYLSNIIEMLAEVKRDIVYEIRNIDTKTETITKKDENRTLGYYSVRVKKSK